ncbi:hypothetical protein [Reyranella sp.]|jgi:hypothetical protein|uniref:hypothetical protein n=1 Tax=Reyranella sp. TaxID=1929291 RepID=UPI002F93539C
MSGKSIVILALGAMALTALPLAQAMAQSGDALANAEYTCSNHGVPRNTQEFDVCVGRAALAFDQGRPVLAERQADLVGDADKQCRFHGIAPETIDYRECLDNEIARRAPSRPVLYLPAPLAVDAYGLRYDSDGSPIDRHRYPVRHMP